MYFISIACIDYPVLRGYCQEAKRGEAGGHRITRNCEALWGVLLPCATTEVSLIAMWCLIGATPRGQPWTPAVTLPHKRHGLSARRMAVLYKQNPRSLRRNSRWRKPPSRHVCAPRLQVFSPQISQELLIHFARPLHVAKYIANYCAARCSI